MHIKSLAFALTFAAFAGAAQAEVVEYGSVDSWQIYRDSSMGNGCYTTNQYEDDSLLMLGFDLAKEKAFVAVFSPDIGTVEDGELYEVDIHLDSEQYTADAVGITGDAQQDGMLVFFEDDDFLVDLAQGQSLTIAQGKTELASLSLEASKAAVLTTIQCLEGN